MLKHASCVVLALSIFLNPWLATFSLAGEIDPSAKTYLEGVWLLGKRPKGPCVSTDHDGATQWGFEFEKTGGRLLHYEPQDFFSPVILERIEKRGDELTLWMKAPSGEATLLGQLRLLPPDRFEMLPARPNDEVQSPQPESGDAPETAFAYRCGTLDRSVTGEIPINKLALLTPLASVSSAMVEVQPGMSDADLCRLRPLGRWIKFDVLGPAHFYAVGSGLRPEFPIDLDLIRKVDMIDENAFRLTLQRHSRGEKGWDTKGGQTYQLTVIGKDSRIEIPELSATFTRCNQLVP